MNKTIIALASLLIPFCGIGATITAVSCNYPDVTNAVAHAAYGDTVVLPNGVGSWWNTVNISGITLQGQGTNNTIIQDNTPISGGGYYNGTPILAISGTNASLTRVTGIQFKSGVTNNLSTAPGNYGAEITIGGSCPKWQIDTCSFILLSGKNIRVTDESFGIVSQCAFNTQSTISLEVFGNGYGDSAWAATTTYGSTNAVMFENNFCHDNFSFGWVDCSQGGRLTYRYNYLEGCYLNTHGAETSQRYRSSRWVECYMNIFTNTTIGNFNNMATAVDLRGGGALVWSNTVYGYKFMTDIEYYRSDDNNPGFAPWYGMTGVSGWDKNGLPMSTGVATSTTNKLLTSLLYSNNIYVGCTVYNLNNTLCGIVSANTSNVFTFTSSRDSAYQIKFTGGDTYQIYRPYFGVDQPGAGQCDLLTNLFSPTPVYLNFQTNIVCNWSNTVFTYANFIKVPGSQNAVTPYPNIVNGRDYTNSVKVGYTPLTYPYPYLVTNNSSLPAALTPTTLLGPVGQISNMR